MTQLTNMKSKLTKIVSVLVLSTMGHISFASGVSTATFSDGTILTGDFSNPKTTQIVVSNDSGQSYYNGTYTFQGSQNASPGYEIYWYFKTGTLDYIQLIENSFSIPVAADSPLSADTIINEESGLYSPEYAVILKISSPTVSVPEPASIALIAGGLLGIGAYRKKAH